MSAFVLGSTAKPVFSSATLVDDAELAQSISRQFQPGLSFSPLE